MRGRSTPRDEPGNDRVIGTFAGADAIRMRRIQHETRAAVLHRDTGPGNDDAGTESAVVRLDHRHHHAVRVSRCQIDRVVPDRQRGRRQARSAVVRSNAPGHPRRAEQLLRRDPHRAPSAKWSNAARIAIFIASICRWMLRTSSSGARQFEMLQDRERNLRRKALTVRRDLVQGDTAIGLGIGVTQSARCAARSCRAHDAASRVRCGDDPFREFAAIKRLTARLRFASACGEIGTPEQFARVRRTPSARKCAPKSGLSRNAARPVPIVRRLRAHMKATRA